MATRGRGPARTWHRRQPRGLAPRYAHNVFPGVTMVEDVATARDVAQHLMTLTDAIHAVDTETSFIEITAESPWDTGDMICLSIFCGDGHDFGMLHDPTLRGLHKICVGAESETRLRSGTTALLQYRRRSVRVLVHVWPVSWFVLVILSFPVALDLNFRVILVSFGCQAIFYICQPRPPPPSSLQPTCVLMPPLGTRRGLARAQPLLL